MAITKYKDADGNWQNINVKVMDTLPIGSVVEFDGASVPSGWEEIQDVITNQYGTAIKYANGIMICTRKIQVNANINTAWGNLFYWHDRTNAYNFAASFIEPPTLFKEPVALNGIGFMEGDYGTGTTITTSSFTGLSLFRPTSSTNAQVEFNILAIGRWK